MALRSPRSLNAVVRNETSVRKGLPDFRTQPTLPRSRLATTRSHNATAAAKAGSPDCLAWPRGTARAFTVLTPDPVRRGDAGFGGRMELDGIGLIVEGPG